MTFSYRAALAVLTLAMIAASVHAHDSWLSPSRNASPPGTATVEAATGNRFPVQDVDPQAANMVRPRCIDGRGRVLPLLALKEEQRWLEMRANAAARGEPPLACAAEIRAFEIELPPNIVQIYLDEIHASQAQRASWADLQARAKPWRESYRKLMRIELAAAGVATAPQRVAARKPLGMELEIVVLGDAPIAVGQLVEYQLLRDGRPLAGFPIELISERSKIGIWRDTDGEGKVRHTLPFGGRWLLRGTDLQLSDKLPDTWESRFVTLAVEAAAAR